jgi:hypothetical protein
MFALAGSQPREVPMTDYPRFHQVTGEPDVAHQAYNGGRLVSFVFRLVDSWIGRSKRRQAAPDLGAARGGIEIHERAPSGTPAEFLPGAAEAMAPVQLLHRQAPDDTYSREFLIGSARTMKPQRALLAAFVAVLAVLVVQGWSQLEQPNSQAAGNAAPAFSEAIAAHHAEKAPAGLLH